MRIAQLSLGIPTSPLSKEAAAEERKRSMIRGRPRRLTDASVVKVAVSPELVPRIDRIRENMNATRPEFVRSALERLLHKTTHTLPDSIKEHSPRKVGRCAYWKVPVAPEMLARIDSIGLGMGIKKYWRQRIITHAIEEGIRYHLK